jgi:hypothetical protein
MSSHRPSAVRATATMPTTGRFKRCRVASWTIPYAAFGSHRKNTQAA